MAERCGPALALVLALACAGVCAEAGVGQRVAAWTTAHQHALLDEYEAFVRIPNVTTDGAALRRNAEHLRAMMERRGLAPRMLDSAVTDAAPTLLGTWRVPGATRSLVLYAHYDGVSVDAAQWPSDPWTPVWRRGRLEETPEPVARDRSRPIDPDWRVYARAASDDKAGVFALLAAVDALRASGESPTANLVFLFDGEEEQGSPNLRALLERHRTILASDGWLICDGTVHASGRPQLVFGARGLAGVDLTVHGARRALHSGQFGNFAPNPALRLAHLLASMKDDDGRVLVRGWYDDVVPLGPAERAALDAAPDDDATLLRELGLAAGERAGTTLAEAITAPSLNIDGLRAADVGAQARNIIPGDAQATLDLRLVQGNTVAVQFERLVAHVRDAGYHVIDRAPTELERTTQARIATIVLRPGGYAAARTPMDLPLARDVTAALRGVAGEKLLLAPTLGGSLPLSVVTETLGVPVLVLPISNADNRQHAENENLRVGALWDGIAALAAVMQLPRGAAEGAR
jgi:acetylornithine deacetylase/succinyl-diaminopimelate desuccinylase-like protein